MTAKTDWDIGKQEAQQLLKKHKPKTTRGVIKVKRILQERLKSEYELKPIEWKNGYGQGAYDAIIKYQEDLVKQFFKR